MNNRKEIEKPYHDRLVRARMAMRKLGKDVGLTAARDCTYWRPHRMEQEANDYLAAVREYKQALESYCEFIRVQS